MDVGAAGAAAVVEVAGWVGAGVVWAGRRERLGKGRRSRRGEWEQRRYDGGGGGVAEEGRRWGPEERTWLTTESGGRGVRDGVEEEARFEMWSVRGAQV